MTRVSVPEIIGRRAELAALDGMRSGGLALISGDAGVGKSRLVETFVDRLGPSATVLSGGCLQFETDVPFAPFAEALPGLFGDLPDRVSAYRRVAEAIAGAGDRVVLVLEDLHWADAATRDLLLYLTRALAGAPVLLVVTCRTDEFAAGHPVATLLAELTRAPRTERLHLAPLSRTEVAELAGAVLGAEPAADLVDTLVLRAEGNPFFTEELLAAGDTVPYNVHEIVASRLGRLSTWARTIARLASVVGRTVPHDLLAALEPGQELGTALRELVDHGQLTTADPDSYRFRHALIHESLYRDLLPGERRAAHARVARCLDDRPELAPVHSVAGAAAELARHWAAAAEPTRALASSLRAAEAAEAGLAPAAAHAHYERALEFLADARDPAVDRDTLLERAAEAASLAGHNQRAVELTTTRLSELDASADPVRAALANEQLSYQARSAGNWALARKASEEATRLQPPGSPARLRLESWLMMLDMLSAHHLDAVRRAERLLPAAIDATDQMPLNRALTVLGTGSVMLGQVTEGVENLHRHQRFAGSSGTPRFVGVCYVNMSEALIWADRQEEALALAREGVARAPEYGFDIYLLPIVGNAVRALAELHRWDEALDPANDPDDPAADPFNWVFVDLPRADVLLRRGAPVRALLDRIGAVLDGQDDVQYGTELADLRARLAGATGRWADARAAVHEGLRLALSGQDLWLVARLVATGVAIEMTEGDPTAADALLAAGRSHRDALAAQGVRPLPRTERAWRLAEAERTPSPEAWAEVADHTGVDRHQAAYARYREAAALLTAKGSRRRAAEALAWASATAAELGAAPLADRVAQLASRARLATGPTTPFADLTARELEILTLVSQGRTNAEIAAELFISTKTASVHVSNILRKLGLKSRIQAAALAHRHLDD